MNPPKERKCRKCPKTYYNSSTRRRTWLCDSCLETFQNRSAEIDKRTLQYYLDKAGGVRTALTFHEARHHAHRRNKHRPQLCQRCSYSKHIEYAHIKPLSSFNLETPIGEINAENNILLLCPNCHWEFDHGLLRYVPGVGLEPTQDTAYETAALPLS